MKPQPITPCPWTPRTGWQVCDRELKLHRHRNRRHRLHRSNQCGGNGASEHRDLTLATLDDALADNGETIIIDIDSIVDTDGAFEAIAEDSNANQVTTVINDQTGTDNPPGTEDTVLVSLTGPGSVVEGETTTDYTVSLDTAVPAGKSVTVNLSYTGTATDGTDYTVKPVLAGGNGQRARRPLR
ncbi:hypothetical protein [Marinomonas algicola]|uniref:hypothetical protein n=1 Tax=Marinomonas algicola TaxID=2773454 RepID=UPI001749E9AC|nr:hypothetical protein [Marinomonas algicola]